MENPTRDNRIQLIDALRGFALAGIVIAHVYEQFTAAPRPAEGWGVTPVLADHIAGGAIWILIYGKFYSLFALLFGVSFGVMMERAANRGHNFSGRFIWRLCLLLGFGIVHSMLYRGDILTAYVLIGLLLPLFYRLPDKWLWLLVGLLMLGVGQWLVYAIIGKASFLPWDSSPESPEVAAYIELLKHGSFLQIAQENLSTGLAHKFDFLFAIFGRAYMTLAYFLVGLWLVRHRIVHKLGDFKPQIKRTMWISLAAALVFFGLNVAMFIIMPEMFKFTQWKHVFGFSFYNFFNIAFTVFIACAFALLALRTQKAWPQAFANYGRLALSNYILQSVIGTVIFFGFGLGLLGEVHDWQAVLLALAIIAVQMVASTVWLRHFQYGPLEWLWRCGTWLKWLPIKKAPTERPAGLTLG